MIGRRGSLRPVTGRAVRTRKVRARVFLGALLALGALLILGGAWVSTRQGAVGQAAARPTPLSDMSHLVVQGHNQAVSATLAGGMHVSGTLYPALPGANTLTLTLSGTARGRGKDTAGTLGLRVTMPGMAMAPLRVALRERAGRYRGVITLPMFGAYVARVVLVAEQGQWQGTMRVLVPLLVRGM